MTTTFPVELDHGCLAYCNRKAIIILSCGDTKIQKKESKGNILSVSVHSNEKQAKRVKQL